MKLSLLAPTVILSLGQCVTSSLGAAEASLPKAIHPLERRTPWPSPDSEVSVNPPSLLCPLEKGSSTRYTFRLSPDASFLKETTTETAALRWGILNPHRELKPGPWYWQFAVIKAGSAPQWSKPLSFRITPDARKFSTPPIDQMLAAIPGDRPRILTTSRDIDAYRKRWAGTGTGDAWIRSAKRLLNKPLPDIAASGPKKKGKNEYEQKNFAKWASKDLALDIADEVNHSVHAFLLTGDTRFAAEAVRRAELIASWDPDGFTSPKVSDFADGACMRAMALAYDVCQQQFSPAQKKAIRNALEYRTRHFFDHIINNLEAKVFNAHIWQHILHQGFQAAVALHGEYPRADDWIAYAYELWIARFPLLGGEDGSWGEGINYFAVNFTTLLEMPGMFERLTGTDFLAHPWYRNAPHYLLYCWPPGSASDSFGDGAERPDAPGPGFGTFTAALGSRFRDPVALWYAREILGKRYAETVGSANPPLPEPAPPTAFPQARAFPDNGVVSMHTALGDPSQDLMIGFRSSPFGSFGHVHRDQNSFSLLYGGKRLFQGSGYYIAFGDEHFEKWYTTTRAHNTVLIDGKGQQDGTEGYGWISRFLHGKVVSYCLGDASHAYGDAGLTRFRRHLALLRPNLVVIYDDLAANHDAAWSWLLHSPDALRLEGEQLLGGHELAGTRTHLLASSALDRGINTEFDPPAENWRGSKKYENQWHFAATTTDKVPAARFLALIVVQPTGVSNAWDAPDEKAGGLHIGPWCIRAEMDPSKPASLFIENTDGTIALAADSGAVRHGNAPVPIAPGCAALSEAGGGIFSECADGLPGASNHD